MEEVTIITSRAIRAFKEEIGTDGPFVKARAVRAIEGRYDFRAAPRIIADYDISNGIEFGWGYFGDTFEIERFAIYRAGLLVQCPKVSTDEADRFLDDLIAWACTEFELEYDESEHLRGRGYQSQLEFKLPSSIRDSFEKFANVGSAISGTIKDYGLYGELSDFEVTGIHLGAEVVKDSGIFPEQFILERRNQQPFETGIYFSQAPLRTSDHLRLLGDLVGALGS